MALEVISLGIEARTVTAQKERAVSDPEHVHSFWLCESLRRFAEFLGQQMTATFNERESKMVLAVSRIVE